MGERAEHFERSSGRGLPASYRTFINAFDGAADAFGGGPRVKDAGLGLEFRLSTADELLAPYTPDGTGITRPFFSAHIVHLARLRDAGVLIFDGGADPVSPERFESMNTIGVGASAAAWEQNQPPTHLLVLDPADASLRAVPTDAPAVVRKVAESFARWIKAATRKPRKLSAKTTTKKPATPKVKKVKPVTPATVLAAFKKANKLTLPLAYAKFLKAHDGSATFPGPGGEQWVLATLAELSDPNLGSVATADGSRIPASRLTRVYADALKAGQGVTSVPVWGTKRKFTLARLRKALCVGHCNGDPLFLDPTTKYSVWGYNREGKFVAKLADTFATFLKPKAKMAKKATTTRKPAAKKSPARKAKASQAEADVVKSPVVQTTEVKVPVVKATGRKTRVTKAKAALTTPAETPVVNGGVPKAPEKPAAKVTKPRTPRAPRKAPTAAVETASITPRSPKKAA
jgi:hypothetical protein